MIFGQEMIQLLRQFPHNFTTSVPAVRRAEAELFLVLVLLLLRGGRRLLGALVALVVFLVLEAVDVEAGAARHRPLLLGHLLAVVVLLAGALDAGDDRLVRLDEVARPTRQSGG